VGITRAMTNLTITWAQERARYGRKANSMPSRFIYEAQDTEMPIGWVGIEATATADEDEDAPPAKGRGKKKAAKKAPAKRARKKTG
jgi:hypothetical protein